MQCFPFLGLEKFQFYEVIIVLLGVLALSIVLLGVLALSLSLLEINRDVHFAVNSKILLSAVTQFEFAVNSAVNRNYQRYEKR